MRYEQSSRGDTHPLCSGVIYDRRHWKAWDGDRFMGWGLNKTDAAESAGEARGLLRAVRALRRAGHDGAARALVAWCRDRHMPVEPDKQ